MSASDAVEHLADICICLDSIRTRFLRAWFGRHLGGFWSSTFTGFGHYKSRAVRCVRELACLEMDLLRSGCPTTPVHAQMLSKLSRSRVHGVLRKSLA